MLKSGDPAPDIQVKTDSGADFRLSDMKGKRLVLYFYPKANTPGCTTESCEFRDLSREFDRKGAVILGISPDSPKAQTSFKAKHQLPFTLLCDEDKSVAEAYGVLKEKNMYGRKVMGIQRSTFVIGPDGRIEQALYGVKSAGHAAELSARL